MNFVRRDEKGGFIYKLCDVCERRDEKVNPIPVGIEIDPGNTPLKFNMEPENESLEKEIFLLGNHHFQVKHVNLWEGKDSQIEKLGPDILIIFK